MLGVLAAKCSVGRVDLRRVTYSHWLNLGVRQYRSCMMSDTVTIIGVHEIEAGEPVHLIEIEVTGDADRFDFGDVTQADENVPRDNWQCAYDEREIYSPTAGRRFAFFLHYLNFELPLATSFGDIDIPEPTPIPERLGTIEYEAP